MKKIRNYLIIIILSFCFTTNLTACNSKAVSPISLSSFYFDTAVTITIYNPSSKEDATEIINECFNLCKNYENLFSRTVKDSDISKINAADGLQTTVHPEVAEIIRDSLKYSQLSHGAFDITIAPLSSLWDIKNNNGTIPPEESISAALEHINYKNIVEGENSVTLTDPKAQIDLGGIAKGFVADKLKQYMKSKGVTSAIIDLGGNILTIGGKTSENGFVIGIKKPFSQDNSEYVATIRATDKSVVTSGIYERYFEKDNKIYHHILNTKTGYPVENNLYSVTIISDTSEAGDALSTSAFALGLDDGRKLINFIADTEAVFITNENEILLTDGLKINGEGEISF